MNNPNPILYERKEESNHEADPLVLEVFDLIRDIKDPEHPHTLEELNVVREDCITLHYLNSPNSDKQQSAATNQATPKGSSEPCLVIRIEFSPTVPHCSLATMIGLCIRVKLQRSLAVSYKLDVLVVEGTHSIEEDVNKQINDKERVAAAMENPSLRDVVEECIKEPDY